MFERLFNHPPFQYVIMVSAAIYFSVKFHEHDYKKLKFQVHDYKKLKEENEKIKKKIDELLKQDYSNKNEKS